MLDLAWIHFAGSTVLVNYQDYFIHEYFGAGGGT